MIGSRGCLFLFGPEMTVLLENDFALLDIAGSYEQESGWSKRLRLRLQELMKEHTGMDVAASPGSKRMKGADASVGIRSTG